MNTMKMGFLLGKEHETLPYSELKALLEIYNINKNLTVFNNYAVLDNLKTMAKKEEYIKYIKNMIKRSAYINEGHLIVFEMKYIKYSPQTLNVFYKKLMNLPLNNILNIGTKDTFAVRALKIPKGIGYEEKIDKKEKEKNIKIDSMVVERNIGKIIKEKTCAKVNLKNPSKVVKVVLLKDRIYLVLSVEKRDKSYFQKNRPHLRAYFHPGCIIPKLARCMVNLARLKEGNILLDPFCGTGGFLIEGGFIGCKLIGSDIDNRMVEGTILNLKSYNLMDKVIAVKRWDAEDIKNYLNLLNIKRIDAIITDPPYGISTSAKGDVELILNNLGNVLKNGGYMVFASSKKINVENLKLKEIYKLYVHKSLTRYIHVYRKE